MKNAIRIYHNPACGTSRNTLAIIRNTGEEPEIIEYLDNPPSRTELAYLINSAKLTVREAIRKNVEPYTQLELENDVWTDDELLTYMLQYPILINRPFVVTELGVKLCRPSEEVLSLLVKPQLGAFAKEDGEKVVDENGKFIGLVTDGDIRRMLARGAEFLDEPVEDLMTKNPVIITKDKMAAEALSMMEKHQPKPITVLPVIDVEKNEPVGIVHLTDLLRQGVV